MSKKIQISLSAPKAPLKELFTAFLIRKEKEGKSRRKRHYIDESYEDDYDDDEYRNFFHTRFGVCCPSVDPNHKGGKGKKKGSSKAVDPYNIYWGKDDEKGKKGKHTKGKRAKTLPIDIPYSGFEEDPSEIGEDPNTIDFNFSDVTIYFYEDYHDQTERLEFSSFKEFDDFCVERGYQIPQYCRHLLLTSPVSHCCVDPLSLKYGFDEEIVVEDSYGALFYSVSEVEELKDI